MAAEIKNVRALRAMHNSAEQAAAEALPVGSLGTGGLDDLIDLAGGQATGPLVFGFLADDAQYFGLRRGKLDVIADAEQPRRGRSALLDGVHPQPGAKTCRNRCARAARKPL